MYQRYVKRLMDILVALLVLPLLMMSFIIVAPFIWAEDGFPIFYKADRIGRGGKLFKMYKFRSMMTNAPDRRLTDGSMFTAENDPRVTKVGRLLRKTSVDELPQFLNVLKGDMSIVGPRPFVPVADSKDESQDFKDRLLAKPGITGYTQAYFRNAISQDEKIRYDAIYARKVTFVGDVKIFLKTIETVAMKKNIYRKVEQEEQV